jgi:predicted GTPase
MFDMEVAKVGVGVDPETMDIEKYELDNLIIWDTPGLGDGKEKDIAHAKAIIKKLNELDEKGEPLIDLVLVILDGSSRDLGTSYELINKVIIPNLGENPEKRILIAVNCNGKIHQKK